MTCGTNGSHIVFSTCIAQIQETNITCSYTTRTVPLFDLLSVNLTNIPGQGGYQSVQKYFTLCVHIRTKFYYGSY